MNYGFSSANLCVHRVLRVESWNWPISEGERMFRVKWSSQAALLVAACVPAIYAVHAQDYPVRAVRMIVPFAPGGASDLVARMVSPKLSQEMGQ